MHRQPLVCASPWHRGDRYIASRVEAFERRIEFRRLTDRGRESVVLDRIVCRRCVGAEVAERRGEAGPKTAPLSGEGPGA